MAPSRFHGSMALPAAIADRVSRPGVQQVGGRGNRYHIYDTQRHPALSTNNLQSWSQPECGQSEANSSRSAKGIGLSMRTHCQTAVLLPYLAPMRGGIAIPGLLNFSIETGVF